MKSIVFYVLLISLATTFAVPHNQPAAGSPPTIVIPTIRPIPLIPTLAPLPDIPPAIPQLLNTLTETANRIAGMILGPFAPSVNVVTSPQETLVSVQGPIQVHRRRRSLRKMIKYYN